jgi:ATP-dependent Zn protease
MTSKKSTFDTSGETIITISKGIKELQKQSKRIYMKNRQSTVSVKNDITEQSDDNIYEKETEEKQKEITMKTQYTFSSKGPFSFYTISYVLQEFMLDQRHLVTQSRQTHEYEYNYKDYKEIIVHGNIVFEWQGNLYNMYIDSDNYSNILKSNVEVTSLVHLLKEKIRYKNPLRGKLFQVKQARDGFFPIMKPIPKITFKDVIIDQKLKEDIYDNTIFQLENLDENNGIILHGEPGVGKSLICSAIANECTLKGNTVCYLSTEVDYTMLNEFLESFVSPCILIFEDIDAFGQTRDSVPSSGILSDFLQFVNGISEKDERIIFVATTNYLDKLDKAISNRPVRFNRKFKFEYPNDEEITQLVELYFDKNIADSFSTICYNRNFSGSHIKEVQRTANLLSKKRNQDIQDVFKESVDLVAENFSPKLTQMGFGIK